MLKHFFLALALMTTAQGFAAAEPEWKNPAVNQINREARRADFFAFENAGLAKTNDKTKSGRYLSMEGKWRFSIRVSPIATRLRNWRSLPDPLNSMA